MGSPRRNKRDDNVCLPPLRNVFGQAEHNSAGGKVQSGVEGSAMT
jgi:hypothetical protein